MAYARPIRDMHRGDIWTDLHDPIERVVIVAAGNHYVEFMAAGGVVAIWYDAHFRARYAPVCDRTAIRAQFAMSLANLDSFHAFWCPVVRRMFARSTSRSVDDAYRPGRGRGGAVPRSALYIGTYSNPCPPEDFLGDLDALMVKIRKQEQANGATANTNFAIA